MILRERERVGDRERGMLGQGQGQQEEILPRGAGGVGQAVGFEEIWLIFFCSPFLGTGRMKLVAVG